MVLGDFELHPLTFIKSGETGRIHGTDRGRFSCRAWRLLVQVFTSSSIGITIYPFDNGDPDQILKHADLALYQAKRTNRGSLSPLSSFRTAVHARHVEVQEDRIGDHGVGVWALAA